MPSKPNYNFQRAERDRAKKASKAEKLEEKKRQAELRRSGEAAGDAAEASGPEHDQAPPEGSGE